MGSRVMRMRSVFPVTSFVLAAFLAAAPVNLASAQSTVEAAVEALAARDFDAALAILQPLADAGDPLAIYYLGDMYRLGYAVDPDLAHAAELYLQAAEAGVPEAQDTLALMYLRGMGVERDAAQAFYWLQQAADQGYGPAEVALGLRYLNGEGVERDVEAALHWFYIAADKGLPEAEYQLGLMYATGNGVEQDFAQAVAWTQLAADKGFLAAHYNLGVAYEGGQGVEPDPVKAFFHFAVAYIMSGQGPGGPIYPALNDAAQALTRDQQRQGLADAQAWVDAHNAAPAD